MCWRRGIFGLWNVCFGLAFPAPPPQMLCGRPLLRTETEESRDKTSERCALIKTDISASLLFMICQVLYFLIISVLFSVLFSTNLLFDFFNLSDHLCVNCQKI